MSSYIQYLYIKESHAPHRHSSAWTFFNQTGNMKIAILLLAVLPFAMSAKIDDKRFIESLLGGYDILALAQQLLGQFGCDETEKQCESTMCPDILNRIDGHNQFITSLVCAPVCKEAQVLANTYAHGPVDGVDPCTGSVGIGGR